MARGRAGALSTLARRRLAALLTAACAVLIALCGVGVAVATAPAAFAAVPLRVPSHADVRSVSPADGTSLERVPTEVVVVFTEQVNPAFVQINLTSNGAAVPLGTPLVSGGTVTVPVLPGRPEAPGAYRIAFRVVSADGHPVSGSSAFTVTGSATTGTPSPATSAPASSPAATSGAASSPSPVQPAAAPTAGQSASGVPVAAGLGGLLVVAGAGALLWRRRRPR